MVLNTISYPQYYISAHSWYDQRRTTLNLNDNTAVLFDVQCGNRSVIAHPKRNTFISSMFTRLGFANFQSIYGEESAKDLVLDFKPRNKNEDFLKGVFLIDKEFHNYVEKVGFVGGFKLSGLGPELSKIYLEKGFLMLSDVIKTFGRGVYWIQTCRAGNGVNQYIKNHVKEYGYTKLSNATKKLIDQSYIIKENGLIEKISPLIPSGYYKKGGQIKKSGLYRLHKGEVVVPAYKVKTVDKALHQINKKKLKKKCKTCILTNKQLLKRKVT
jgi:hypothetical protein